MGLIAEWREGAEERICELEDRKNRVSGILRAVID